MQSNYKALGNYIQEVNIRNTELNVDRLLGVSIQKVLMPSIANTIGTDMTNYKILKQNQFAYGPVTSRNGDKISIALLDEYDEAIISQAYTSFEITDTKKLHPEYLMMWFRRPEFDRYARFMSHGSAREVFGWDELCNTMLPIPTPEKQREIVTEYNTVKNRIELNNQLIQKLEETAQAIYKQWFVDFEFPDENGNPYKSSGGKMVYNEELDKEIPEGWENSILYKIATIIMGQSPVGESYNEDEIGVPLVNGPVEFGEYFTVKTKWTTEPKKYCKKNDLIFCVRGSTVGRHVIADDKYAIGRGVCAINSKYQLHLLQLIKFNLAEILKDVTGSTFPNIDRMTLGNYPIIIGGDEILNKFEEKLFPTNQMILLKSKENQMLSELKNLLLSKLATIKN